MSSVRTTTATTRSVSGAVPSEAARLRKWTHLADYELHHSDESRSSGSNTAAVAANDTTPKPSPQQRQQQQQSETAGLQQALHNPPDWPSNYRRIPQHRPINTNLDQSQRRVYTSLGERAFLTMMFTGLEMNVAVNRTWNATLGKVNGDWFRYKIGGEW